PGENGAGPQSGGAEGADEIPSVPVAIAVSHSDGLLETVLVELRLESRGIWPCLDWARFSPKPNGQYLLTRRQGHAHDLLIIPRVHRAVGEGRVRPDHVAAPGGVRRVEHMGAADLVIAPGTEPGDDQVALLRHQEEAVAVLDDEDVARLGLR